MSNNIFSLSLKYKMGNLDDSKVSNEIKALSKLPEDFLKKYAEKNFNFDIEETEISFPGNPGDMNSFHSQKTGFLTPTGKNKHKNKRVYTYKEFLKKIKNKDDK